MVCSMDAKLWKSISLWWKVKLDELNSLRSQLFHADSVQGSANLKRCLYAVIQTANISELTCLEMTFKIDTNIRVVAEN